MTRLPDSVFKYRTSKDLIRHETDTFLKPIGISIDGKIEVDIEGADFRIKTFIENERLAKANILKAVIIESIKICSTKTFIIPTVLSILSTKKLNKILDSFIRIGYKTVGENIFKDEHKTVFSNEFQFFMFMFLYSYGIEEEKADKVAELVAHLMEYDDAYRLRIQDLFSSIPEDTLQYPLKALKLASKLSLDRDVDFVSDKFVKAIRIAKYAFLIPKIKNAYLRALKDVDVQKLKLDDQDIYWCAYKDGYKFQGLTKEEQKQKGIEMGWKYPELIKRL